MSAWAPLWSRRCAILAGGLLLAGSGCSRYREDKWSRQWPPRYAAGGHVERNGAPVRDAVVTFFVWLPDRTPGEYTAVGMTDADGKFSLTTFRPGDGAVAGGHAVTVEKTSVKDGAFSNELPRKYSLRDTSGLTAEVTAKGPNEFVFKLDDSGQVPKAGR